MVAQSTILEEVMRLQVQEPSVEERSGGKSQSPPALEGLFD